MEHLVENLNGPQQEAVRHVDGPLLILAGPGSGKTRVITHRIAHLLAMGVPDYRILALTFTNKAADEMKRRVAELAPGSSVWLGTFHRFCAKLLRQYAQLVGLQQNYTIYDTDDSSRALRQTIESLDLDLTHVTPERIQSAISWAKNHLITPDKYEAKSGSPLGAIVSRVYPAYQKRLLDSSAVDFDDMLMHVATMLRENPELRRHLDAAHRYIMVDEYQDTNLAQYTIVRALSIDYPNLAVTGDPDQSIYGWRGANINNILEFEKDFPTVKVVRLEQNYRSTKRILQAADDLISHNKRRKAKGLFTDNDEGQPVRLVTFFTNKIEAEAIAQRIVEEVAAGRRRPRDFAIFYRINALSRALEFALRDYAVPYQMVNGLEFYQRKEIKDVLAYLHLLNNPRDNVAFTRIINTPPRGIGRSTIGALVDHAARKGIPLLDAAREAGLIESLNKRAAVAVAKFVSMYDQLALFAQAPVEDVMRQVLDLSGYREALQSSDDEGDLERLANIEELITAGREFDEQGGGHNRLEEFLEQACLVNDTDAWEADDDRVTLMTMHAAKGLEFPVVFIIALEEGLIPHERSRQSPDELEEERRLLFVGITRARESLNLSLSRYREFRGQRRMSVPSQFLMELPRDQMDTGEVLFAHPAWDGDHSEHHDPHPPDEIHIYDEPHVQPPQSIAGVKDTESGGRRTPADSVFLARQATAGLTLASALVPQTEQAQSEPPTPLPPDAFEQGMVVRHPEYGLGKIVATSGNGAKRSATIAFAGGAGEKKFLLIHSRLALVK